ncbi:hypothetical protein ACO1O0_005092 [Amphichorda felina]
MRKTTVISLAALTHAVPAIATTSSDILKLQAQLPECSVQCIAEVAAEFDCSVTDISCQCSQVEAITKEVAPCLVKKGKCSFEEITDTATAVADICAENAKSSKGNSTVDASEEPSAEPSKAAEEDAEPTGDAASQLQRFGLAGAAALAVAAAIL